MVSKKSIVDQFIEQFNSRGEAIRIVAVLSSSCKNCLKSYDALDRIRQKFASSGKLELMTIWNPSIPASLATRDSETGFHFGDESKELRRFFSKSIATEADAYLLYSPRILWEEGRDAPPSPAFYMTEEATSAAEIRFDASKFEEEARILVEMEDPNFSETQVTEALLRKEK